MSACYTYFPMRVGRKQYLVTLSNMSTIFIENLLHPDYIPITWIAALLDGDPKLLQMIAKFV